MMKFIGIAGFCLLFFIQVKAQTPINEKEFDAHLLQELILEKIDSVRSAYQKPGFRQDSILQQAAEDHANYLAHKQTLSHFQNGNKKKYNPQDRVLFFGGKGYLTGENAAEHPIKVLLHMGKGMTVNRVEDYEQSALLFVQQWVNSPQHFQNLMKDDYSRTGLAVALDPKENRLYAVQVFSPEPRAQ